MIWAEIQQEVRIRKYPVDIKELQQLLRGHKAVLGLSNKDISKALDIPITQVEHYFRTDKYFAIPEEDIWFKLKSILRIIDDSFDKSIMTFVTQPGVYEKGNRIYSAAGLAMTLTCDCGNEKIVIEDE